MKYSNIIDLFKKDDQPKGKVVKVYLLKVGCVSYAEKPEADNKVETKKDEENEKELIEKFDPDKVLQETADALKKNTHVFDLTIEIDKEGWSTGTDEHIFINGGLLKLRIEQPKRFQKYSIYENIKPIEKFDVVSNGATFIAYAPISDLGQGIHIAHEYREIAEKQINEATDYYNPTLGPCPIHPDNYLVFVDYPKKETKEGEQGKKTVTP